MTVEMDLNNGLNKKLNGKKIREFKGNAQGLRFERRYTKEGVHPFDEVEWELRTASIGNERGEVVFEQRDVEMPKSWSQMATNVVVSKYFRGKLGTPERERSVKQLISRVVNTITEWGIKDGIFASSADAESFRAELSYLILHQKMAFNSPVWFNVGVEPHPQASACFINSVEDTMESIMTLAKTECMLFKWGSGAGSNLSKLRSSKEHLSGGGTASGPVSFMRGYDAFAGVVKSGGKTRRAAKMVILDAQHPDIMEFVWCKANEEKKAWALIDAGYDGGFNVPGGAYDSIFFQNANHSVRVSDDFMQAVVDDKPWATVGVCDGQVKDKLQARDVMMGISEAAWLCGDPGLQYDTTINDWHTCINTERIYASNPCVTGDTLVATVDGWRRIDQLLDAPTSVVGADGELHEIQPAFKTGHKPVYRLTTKAGFELNLTADHRVWTKNRGDVPASELSVDDVLELGRYPFGQRELDVAFAEYVGLMVGDGCISGDQGAAILTLAPEERQVAERALMAVQAWQQAHATDGRSMRELSINEPQQTLRISTSSRPVVEALQQWAVLNEGSVGKQLTPEAMQLNEEATSALLRGLFTADGTVANYGEKSQYVSLDSTSEQLLKQVQLLLLGFGIRAKLYRNRRPLGQTMALLPDGKGGLKEYPVEQMHSLRISRQSRVRFEQCINFVEGSAKRDALRSMNEQVSAYADPLVDEVAELSFVGMQDVYDLTEPHTSHFVANGLVVHNCSEFLFLNDTACNLASLNLLTFRDEAGEFDVESFKHAVRLTLTAQEIIVPNASYPTPQIETNSHAFRPLGLGYTNLGALLMVRGLPYDSPEGRAYAGAITALMSGEAYAQSAKIAQTTGPFTGYPVNEEPMLRVIKNHKESVEQLPKLWAPIEADPLLDAARASWKDAYELGKQVGYRNSQVTVLAPTGCVTADTMLLTSEGLLPIVELGDPYGEDWQPLQIKVPQEAEVHSATQFFVNGEELVYGVSTARGHQIKATGKHQVRVVDEYGAYAWRRMDQLKLGDVLVLRVGGHESVLAEAALIPMNMVTPNAHPNAHTFKQPEVMDARLAELIGYYSGDGYLKDRGGLHLVVHEQDQDLAQHLTASARALFGLEVKPEARQGCQVLSFNSRVMVPWFKANALDKPKGNHGEGAEGACVPTAVLRSRSEVLCAYLRGLFEADGTVHLTATSSPIVSLTTVSERLAREVHTALESLGIRATLSMRQPGDSSFGERVKYRVRPASVAELRVFAQKVGFISSRKQTRLVQALEAFNGIEDRGHRLSSMAVLSDLYERSEGLSSELRQDIRARMTQGAANVAWLRRMVEAHPCLAQSKAAALVSLGDVQFVEVDDVEALGVQPTFDISVPHRNTYIANGFVTHNTISFLMDCDTTGIEPDIALIKYKKLVGGGYFKIVNQAVPEALDRLGYSAAQKKEIIDYLMERETIEGAPHLKDEHLNVFDCAFKPANGERSIEPMGHVRMMSAAQPFISGALSKTVNMPSDASVEDIFNVYVEAWKMGLKAIAIYRDGCKRTQPLSTKMDAQVEQQEEAAVEVAAAAVPVVSDESAARVIAQSAPTQSRRRLGDERPSITHKFSIAGHEGYITVGMYEDGQPGEIFITMSKEGSTISGLMDSFATSISLCLQYGVPLEVLVDKFSFTRFEPSGFTNNPRIRMAKSVTDYIFRWLADKFLPADQKLKYLPAEESQAGFSVGASLAEVLSGAKSSSSPAPAQAAEVVVTKVVSPTSEAKSQFAKATPGSVVYDAAAPKKLINAQSDAPPCHVCGSMTVRSGACYLCQTCGATTGCG